MSDQDKVVQFPGTDQELPQQAAVEKPDTESKPAATEEPNPWARLTLSSDNEGSVRVDLKVFPEISVDESTGNPEQGVTYPPSHQVMFRLMNRLELMFNGSSGEPINEDMKTAIGGVLYQEYSNLVGGVNYAGEPLPDWATFNADENKQPQVDAWKGLAEFVVKNFAAA